MSNTQLLIVFCILFFLTISNLKRIFLGTWNIGPKFYKSTRAFLWIMYLGCLTYLIVTPFNKHIDWNGVGNVWLPSGTFAVFSFFLVSTITALDLNYKAGRVLNEEKNRLSHWILGLSFLPPVAVCCFINLPLTILIFGSWIASYSIKKPCA